jgi:hypothetical protein
MHTPTPSLHNQGTTHIVTQQAPQHNKTTDILEPKDHASTVENLAASPEIVTATPQAT